MPHKVFWLEQTGQERCWLRRYRSAHAYVDGVRVETGPGCPLPWGYHDHMVFLKDRPTTDFSLNDKTDPDKLDHSDPRWPKLCNCGYEFQEDDEWQLFHGHLYSGAPDGQLYTLREAPTGAMWDATWFHAHAWAVGPDGISLHVKLPNGHDWCVDQEANNCTKTQWQPVEGQPNTRRWAGRTHYCWTRFGDPRTGIIDVGKQQYGATCDAGAGSILSGSYHGFLRNGFLTD